MPPQALVGVVLLIDSDPPSGHGEIGLYTPGDSDKPPDPLTFWNRHGAIKRFVRDVTSGNAVVTVHTSQRYRTDMLAAPYVDAWHELTGLGADLALHAHEDRVDGTSLYDDVHHIERVITEFSQAARRQGLSFNAFRSGFFAFAEQLPTILADRGIFVDLSAAAGLSVPERGVCWQPGIETSFRFANDQRVLEIPLGWSGKGSELGHDYLFNERQTFEGLKAVYESIRWRATDMRKPRLVNLLCHGFGLVQPAYFDQLADIVNYIRSHDGVILGIEAAQEFHDKRPWSLTK